jgi:hypothetical protein
MKTLSNQELAKELFNINWTAVQSDNMHNCENVKQLVHQIEESNLTKEQIIRLFLNVLEAKELDLLYNHDGESPFQDMNKFEYLNVDGWGTKDYK